jgi:tRNA-Thr(GGU) m(6)t(6)A37 methyltransferase TsaA
MTAPDPVVCKPIGVVHSRFTEAAGMPIQTAGAPEEIGSVEVFAEYAAGLKDIEGFDYLILLTHLHRGTNELLEVVPFLDTETHGIFATRAPARPNKIGLSIVRLTSVEGRILHFNGNDMLDQTPVLDIKPYVPRFDARSTERVGWFGPRLDKLSETRSDDRMNRP